MTENPARVTAEGDVLGVAGSNTGTVNITYISQTSSETQIQALDLIEPSPYLGLEKFGVEDHDKFFGRDEWIVDLTEHLKKKKVLLLLGASGSGKSSLIQAGLIPALRKEKSFSSFQLLSFVPDVNPFESFYGCLLAKYKQEKAQLARKLEENTLINVVQSLKSNSQWLIFIDQFEEVFTRTPKTEQSVFIKSLIQLIEKSDDSVKVVMTMRADFLDKLSPYPDLGKIHDRYSRMLTDMDDVELRLAIAEPAAINGVIFEKGLIDQIIADFQQQAGSLPLLQYTLDLLWKNDDIQDRVLNTKTYQDLEGVTGALQKQANTIYDNFDGQQRKSAEQIFLELISLEGKEPVSRRADKAIFEQDDIQKEVLYQLIDNRLLVSRGEDGKATVEVAHEKLLSSWQVLQELIRENEQNIILRNRLYADAKQWDELRQQDSQKAEGELWIGSKLARIVELRKEQSLPNLDAAVIAFIDASVEERDRIQKAEIERQKRAKRTAQGIAVGSMVAVMISSGLGWTAWQKTRQAEYNQAESLGRYALSLVKNEGRDLDAFITALKARKILQNHHTTNPEVMNALQEALSQRKERNRLTGHQDFVYSVAITPDGKTLVSGSDDKTIKVWNLETGGEPRTLTGHQGYVTSVAITPDGKTLVSGSGDNTIKVWDLDFDSLMKRSCNWVRGYLENPYSDVSKDDRHLCDGIGEKK